MFQNAPRIYKNNIIFVRFPKKGTCCINYEMKGIYHLIKLFPTYLISKTYFILIKQFEETYHNNLYITQEKLTIFIIVPRDISNHNPTNVGFIIGKLACSFS